MTSTNEDTDVDVKFDVTISRKIFATYIRRLRSRRVFSM